MARSLDAEFDALPDAPASKAPADLDRAFDSAPDTPESALIDTPAPTNEPGIGETLLHHGTGGFFKQWSDELTGQIAKLDPRQHGNGVAYRMPSGLTRLMETPEQTADVRQASEREELKRTAEAHPLAAFLANVGGEAASDFALSRLGIPVASLPY